MSFRKFSIFIMVTIILMSHHIQSQESVSSNTIESDMLEEWVRTVSSWETRTTGSDAHKICIDWIARQFDSIGLKPYRDPHLFNCSTVDDISLSIITKDGDKTVGLASAYPFSGITCKTGVTGNLVYISGKKYKKAKGKIAVVEVPDKNIPTDVLFNVVKEYPSGQDVLPVMIRNPVLSSTLFGPKLDKFHKAGALGVIAVWKNMSTGLASGQYVPFTLPYFSIPAVWAAGDEGEKIVAAAKNNLQANLRLPGSLDTATVHTVWTVLEGEKRDETILVVTHTDGTNPVEENGFIGLLNIANKLKHSGKKPERTIVFVAVAGHLRLPDITRHSKEQATTVWLKEHPEWWDGKKGNRKAVAGIIIEHLGAMEWADKQTEYVPTGRPEIEIVYATSNKMQEIASRQWQKRTAPMRTSIVTPRSIRHLGEGEPLFEAKIPTVALLGIPSYLLCEVNGQPPGINRRQLHEIVNNSLVYDQCAALYSVIQEIMTLPADKFGRVKHVGFFGKMVDIAKLIKVLIAKE